MTEAVVQELQPSVPVQKLVDVPWLGHHDIITDARLSAVEAQIGAALVGSALGVAPGVWTVAPPCTVAWMMKKTRGEQTSADRDGMINADMLPVSDTGREKTTRGEQTSGDRDGTTDI